MHRNARSERSLNHRKANYDPDQFTEENSKNPSLNSTLGCLKVVDTFRGIQAVRAEKWGASSVSRLRARIDKRLSRGGAAMTSEQSWPKRRTGPQVRVERADAQAMELAPLIAQI